MDFRADESGSTLPIFAVTLTAVIALVGATIALGMDSRSANNLQIAADSAALGGATAFINATSPRVEDRAAEAQRAAAAIAQQNASYTLTDVGIASLVEDAYGQHAQIDIALQFEPVNAMAKVAGRTSSIEIERKASATATWGFPLCILSLKKNGIGLDMNDMADVTAKNCIIWTNSTGDKSMRFRGGRAKTKFFCSAGGVFNRGAQLFPRPHSQCDAIPDPLRKWKAPIPSKCDKVAKLETQDLPAIKLWYEEHGVHIGEPDLRKMKLKEGDPLPPYPTLLQILTGEVEKAAKSVFILLRHLSHTGILTDGPAVGLSIQEVKQLLGIIDNVDPEEYKDDTHRNTPTKTLQPGTYCGLDIAEGHIKMEPGVYIINDAPLTVRRRATLTGEGVTIVLHGDNAAFSVLDEARLTLTAPIEGSTAGLALAEDRRVKLLNPGRLRSRLTGSGRVNAIGTIYLPRQKLSITGDGAADQTSPLLQIVAHNVDISENGALKIVFDPDKTEVPVSILPKRSARLLH